jgi:hypothetical protein
MAAETIAFLRLLSLAIEKSTLLGITAVDCWAKPFHNLLYISIDICRYALKKRFQTSVVFDSL